jgi:hypothetical protein
MSNDQLKQGQYQRELQICTQMDFYQGTSTGPSSQNMSTQQAPVSPLTPDSPSNSCSTSLLTEMSSTHTTSTASTA